MRKFKEIWQGRQEDMKKLAAKIGISERDLREISEEVYDYFHVVKGRLSWATNCCLMTDSTINEFLAVELSEKGE